MSGGPGTARVALVTGAGSGIGRAAALALTRAGWKVALVGRRAEALDETAAMAADPAAVLTCPANVADPEAVKAAFSAATGHFGRLDLLFNNAGSGAPPVPFEDLDVAVWRHVVDVNLTGSFLCAQAAFRAFKAQDPDAGR